MRYQNYFLLLVAVFLSSCGGGGADSPAISTTSPAPAPTSSLESQFNASDCVVHNPFGQPTGAPVTLCRSGYTVGYSTVHKQPAWASYYLNADLVNRQIPRTEDFREDTGVAAPFRSTLEDYSGSGFDRGHIAEAAAVGFDQRSMSESFLLSNMSPQLPAFNRGGWADLEEKIRECTNSRGDLLVVSGAVFQSPSPMRINNLGPSIPDRFYKLVVKLSAPRQAFAVSIKHEAFTLADLGGFVVSPDELELQTGIDFLSGLADSEENSLESSSVDFCGLVTANAPPAPTPEQPTQPMPFPEPAPSMFGPCGSKSACTQMRSCAEANYYYRTCGVSRLDGDNDGIPCEAVCR